MADFVIRVNDQALAEDPDLKGFQDVFQKMMDRMVVSHFKYGCMRDKYPHSASAIASMQKRINMYAESGNTENCLDAANFAAIEYLLPSHDKSHFRAQGSDESPGLEWHA